MILYLGVLSSYLWVGTLRLRQNNANSDLPILGACIPISMSHFPRNLLHSTVFDRCFVQMLGNEIVMLIKLPRIQAGDKLHQRHASPNGWHKWFPTHLCTALQHDHNAMNWRNLQYGQLLLQKYELIGYWRTNNLNNCYDYTDWIDSQSEYFKRIKHYSSLGLSSTLLTRKNHLSLEINLLRPIKQVPSFETRG